MTQSTLRRDVLLAALVSSPRPPCSTPPRQVRYDRINRGLHKSWPL
jgi:hypothetical protein